MPNNRYPIILAHGIARFDVIREMLIKKMGINNDAIGDSFLYFKGIKKHH